LITTRTTNLLERLFVEERRRLKIISIVAVDGVNLKPSPGDMQSDSRCTSSVATSTGQFNR